MAGDESRADGGSWGDGFGQSALVTMRRGFIPSGVRNRFALMQEHERLFMISVSTVLVMAGQGVVSPVLPLFAKEFDVSTATIGLTLSSFALARLILNVPLGVLSDRAGRRILLISGPLVTAVGMVGSGFAGGIGDLLAWRFLAGAGSAMYMTGAIVYLTDISTAETRARFIGTNQAALLVGVSIGPAVGGLLADAFGLRVPFHVVGVAALIAGVYAYLRIPETLTPEIRKQNQVEQARSGERRVWLSLLRSPNFAAVSVVTFGIFFTRAASRQTLVPLLGTARLGLSAGTLGGIFSAMAMIQVVLVLPAATLADRFGRKAAIVPSGIVVMAGLMLYGQSETLSIFLLASLLLALGTSVAGPAPAAFAADIAPPSARGLTMGLHRTMGDVGFVTGPPLLGWLADHTSFGWGFTANAILMGASALIFAVVVREQVGHRATEVRAPQSELPQPGLPRSEPEREGAAED